MTLLAARGQRANRVRIVEHRRIGRAGFPTAASPVHPSRMEQEKADAVAGAPEFLLY